MSAVCKYSVGDCLEMCKIVLILVKLAYIRTSSHEMYPLHSRCKIMYHALSASVKLIIRFEIILHFLKYIQYF